MGQKVNPYGLRLGIIRGWESIWFADKKNYAKSLHEDIKIRNLIKEFDFAHNDDKKSKNKVVSSEIANVEIFRKPDRVTVVINSSRPGVIIGANGENIAFLTKQISKLTSSKVEVKIKEIKSQRQMLR